MSMKKCCVIGSINVDLVITLPRFHRGGETIAGSGFGVFPGGKGGNQAVALGRLGAQVAMVGGIGADANGGMYLDENCRRVS
jgi:ribokinase